MNIAYFGDDFFINCFHVLRKHGHNISYVFVGAEDGYGEKLASLANADGIPVIIGKLQVGHLDQIISEQKIDLVFSAGYCHKINFDYETLPSVNVHPTLLPIGRGPDALAWVTLKFKNYAGVTFHKLSDNFDEGDIVYQKPLIIEERDGWEMYMAKLQIEIARSLSELLEDFSNLYANSVSQEGGSKWAPITALDRRISWGMTHDEIHGIVKAFGRWGAIMSLDDKYWLFNELELSAYQHTFPLGKRLFEDRYAITVSTKEGLAHLAKKNIIREIDIEEAEMLGLIPSIL